MEEVVDLRNDSHSLRSLVKQIITVNKQSQDTNATLMKESQLKSLIKLRNAYSDERSCFLIALHISTIFKAVTQ